MCSQPMKRCSKCQEERPASLEFFYRSPLGKLGLSTYCKPCTKMISKQRYWGTIDPEEITEKKGKSNIPWDGSPLSDEQARKFSEFGVVPKGWRACKKCGRLKSLRRQNFRRYPYVTSKSAGIRAFHGTCRNCENIRRRRTKVRNREGAEMVKAEARIREEANMTPQQLQEAAEAHYGGFKPDRSGPTVIW